MNGQVNDFVDGLKKKDSVLPVPLSAKAKRNIKKNQEDFEKRTGGTISKKRVGTILLETGTLPL